MLVDEEVRQEINNKIIAEIERFERWVESIRSRLADPQFSEELTLDEKRLACRAMGVRTVIYPGTGAERIEVQIDPPAIMKELYTLVTPAQGEPIVPNTVNGCDDVRRRVSLR